MSELSSDIRMEILKYTGEVCDESLYHDVSDTIERVSEPMLIASSYISKLRDGVYGISISYNKIRTRYVLTKDMSGNWVSDMPEERLQTMLALNLTGVKLPVHDIGVMSGDEKANAVASSLLVALLENCPYKLTFMSDGKQYTLSLDGYVLRFRTGPYFDDYDLLNKIGNSHFNYSLVDLALAASSLVPVEYDINTAATESNIKLIREVLEDVETLPFDVVYGQYLSWSVLYKENQFIMCSGPIKELLAGAQDVVKTREDAVKALPEKLDMYLALHKDGEVAKHFIELLNAFNVNTYSVSKWLDKQIKSLQEE